MLFIGIGEIDMGNVNSVLSFLKSVVCKERNSDKSKLCLKIVLACFLTSGYYILNAKDTKEAEKASIVEESYCNFENSSNSGTLVNFENDSGNQIIKGFNSKYYAYKVEKNPYENLYELTHKINLCLNKIEQLKKSNKILDKLILELGNLSLKIKLDLKKYEESSIKTTSITEANSTKTTIELDTTKKDIQLSCDEEKSLSPIYLKTKYPLTTWMFSWFGITRVVNSCNFGILPVGTTALIAYGDSKYINKASLDPWGNVQVEDRKRQNYLFWSTTAYIRFNPFGESGMKVYLGPTVGIGYGKDNKINSDNPSLLTGFSLGFTLDDTKFFALTYGVVYDPNTHMLPDYLYNRLPATFSEVNNSGTLSSFTQNQAITIPLKTVMGTYHGWGFSFSYKF